MDSSCVGKSMNFNVGVLGHVDSGKTSLCKSISTVASTACYDKNLQSQTRGITLDLGFSSFKLDTRIGESSNNMVTWYTPHIQALFVLVVTIFT